MANFRGNEPMNVIGVIYPNRSGNGGMLHVLKDQSGIKLNSVEKARSVDLRPWLTPDMVNGMPVTEPWIQKLLDSPAHVVKNWRYDRTPGSEVILSSHGPLYAFTATCQMTKDWYQDGKRVWVMDVDSISGPGFVMSSRITNFDKIMRVYRDANDLPKRAKMYLSVLDGGPSRDPSLLLGTVYGNGSFSGHVPGPDEIMF